MADPQEPVEFPYGTAFEEQCPYYLSIGMTWDEYWHGDNALPRAYRKKAEIERDRENMNQWRLGQYMMAAIAASLSEKNEYPNEPFPLTESQAEERRKREYDRKAKALFQELLAEQGVPQDD